MSKKRILFILLLIGLASALIAGVIYYKREEQKKHELNLYGNVDVRQVDISFRVPGQVKKLYFEEGDFVKQNSLLAVLDKAPFDQQVAEAEANVAAIKFNLDNSDKLLKRRNEVIPVGGVSQEDLDNAQASHDQLAANLQQAEAALAIAKDNLSYTSVFAPTDGIILSRIREPGTVVRETDPVYTLSVSSPVWIRAYVDEPQLGLIYYGMPAEIHTDVQGGKVYSGKIGFISPVAEFTPKTVQTTQLRTDLVYRLRIYADNPDRGLLQGMPVTVKIKLRENQEKK